MMKPRRSISRIGTDESGHAVIELAVVLPVFLMIALGVFEFGRLIYSYHLIQNGVRDGARYVAGLPYDPANTSQLASQLAATQNIAVRGTATGGTNRVSWWAPSNVGIAYGTVANTPNGACGVPRCYRGGDTLVVVTVSTNVPYSPLGYLGFLGLDTINLSFSHQERLFGVH
jgi:Flp pilus assembly protein TadG